MDNGPLQKLFDLLAVLRGEDGCPWDRAQTTGNILSDLVEEAYELQWAQTQGDDEELLDEMGDVVFVTAFAIALIQEKDPSFTLERITRYAYDKIKRRHPHVFGDAVANTKEEVLTHWERIKALEKGEDSGGAMSDIPGGLPPLRMAETIQRRAARQGFDWQDAAGVLAKIREELDEVEAALDSTGDKTREEIGDLLFSIINLTRFLHIDTEQALTSANAKFIARYRKMEQLATADGHDLTALTLDEMESYWQRAKE